MAKKSKKSTIVEPNEVFLPTGYFDKILDAAEKKFKISNFELDSKVRNSTLVSTGLLVSDLVLGGGILPGNWYAVYGAEGSCKSTMAMNTVIAMYAQSVPIICYIDAEGSFDPGYALSMYNSSKVNVNELFGVKDEETGKWLVTPKQRYYPENLGSRIFAYINSILKTLPDKVYQNDKWWYVFENSKFGKSIAKDKYNKKLYQKTGKLFIEAEDGKPQALFLLDSLPAIIPDSQDDDDPKSGIGARARMYSDLIPKIKGKLRAKMSNVIAVNQLRQKPMVMFGSPEYEPCFVGDTLISLADGRYETIETIVKNRIDVKVLTFNTNTGKLSYSSILDWKDNGLRSSNDLLRLTYFSPETKRITITCTRTHKFWTNTGWIPAEDLECNSIIYTHNITLIPVKIASITYTFDNEATETFHNVYDLTIEGNHTYFANSIAVSNCGEAPKFYSDVRLKQTPRAIPHPLAKGQIEEEDSVESENGIDKYRYICLRTIKNKAMGNPFQEGWARVWITDHVNAGRGFDPVYDVLSYLRMTGQAEGSETTSHKIIKLHTEIIPLKSIKYYDFKSLILLKGKYLKKLCKKLGLTENPKVFKKCAEQIKDRSAFKLLSEASKNK